MEIAVFKKRVTPRNGNKQFTKYISTLTTKKGELVYVDVHFTEESGEPTTFPCTINFGKGDANLTTRTINKGKDNERVVHGLWVKKFTESPYIDTSLDDFE